MSIRIRNLGAKFLAFLLALVVYAHVVTEKEQDTEIALPLRAVGLPEGLVLGAGAPSVVRVAARAKAKMLPMLKVKTPEMVVNLAGARPGEVQRMLSPADVVLPDGVRIDITEVLEPRRATFFVDTLVVAELPVRVRVKGELPEGVCLAESLAADPPRARVIGASRRIEGMSALDTVPLDLARLGKSQVVEIRLDSESGLRATPGVVRVRAVLQPRTTRAFSSVRVHVAGDGRARAQPDTAQVVLDGSGVVLAGVDPADLGIRLEAARLSPGRHFLEPQVLLPRGDLRVVQVIPSRFLVEIGERAP